MGSGKLLYSVRHPGKAQKLAAAELFDYAVKLLAGRACSSAELASKLRRKAERLEDIEPAIARLKELNYLDDARFAENFATARVESSGFGRMRVLSDLRGRRVGGKLADQAVDVAFEGKDENDLIDAFIRKRLPGLALLQRQEEGADRKIASAYRRLRRAGFRPGAILAALKRLGAPPDLQEPVDDDEQDEEQ